MAKQVTASEIQPGREYEFTIRGVGKRCSSSAEAYIDTPGWRYEQNELRHATSIVELPEVIKVGDVVQKTRGTASSATMEAKYTIHHILPTGHWVTMYQLNEGDKGFPVIIDPLKHFNYEKVPANG